MRRLKPFARVAEGRGAAQQDGHCISPVAAVEALARKEYEAAVKLRPDYEEAINNIGTVYYAEKSYRRATTWFSRAVKLAPEESKSAAVYVNLGSAWFSRKNYERAQEAFTDRRAS